MCAACGSDEKMRWLALHPSFIIVHCIYRESLKFISKFYYVQDLMKQSVLFIPISCLLSTYLNLFLTTLNYSASRPSLIWNKLIKFTRSSTGISVLAGKLPDIFVTYYFRRKMVLETHFPAEYRNVFGGKVAARISSYLDDCTADILSHKRVRENIIFIGDSLETDMSDQRTIEHQHA